MRCYRADRDDHLRNPVFYLVAPIVSNLLMVPCFSAPCFSAESLIQVFAEYETKDLFPPALRIHPRYTAAWKILTAGREILIVFTCSVASDLAAFGIHKRFTFSVCSLFENITTPLFLGLHLLVSRGGTGET